MSTINATRPALTVKAAAPVAKTATTTPAVGAVNTSNPILSVAPNTAIDAVLTGVAVGSRTPPVIWDIFKSAAKSGVGLSNVAWFVIPSALRNVRNVASHKISAGRAGANVATETVVGITKGIAAGVVTQSLSIATGPLLGLLPLSPAVLPLVGVGIALAGMMGTYYIFNKVVKNTHVDQKMADGLTKMFGGDLAPAAKAPAAATK